MGKKLNEMKALLAELSEERTQLDAAIEEMIADMAEVPAEQRSRGEWAPDGAMTRKYLDLTNRQAEVEADMAELSRVIVEADESASSIH